LTPQGRTVLCTNGSIRSSHDLFPITKSKKAKDSLQKGRLVEIVAKLQSWGSKPEYKLVLDHSAVPDITFTAVSLLGGSFTYIPVDLKLRVFHSLRDSYSVVIASYTGRLSSNVPVTMSAIQAVRTWDTLGTHRVELHAIVDLSNIGNILSPSSVVVLT